MARSGDVLGRGCGKTAVMMRRPILLFVLSLAVAFAAPDGGQSAAAVSHASLRRAAQELVATGPPAIVIRVQHGRKVTTAAAGLASLETRRRARAGDEFRVGSITKTFVATAVLQLVGERRLHLRDQVGRWLGGLPSEWRQVTIRQLLANTSAIPNFVVALAGELFSGRQPPTHRWTTPELIGLVATQPLAFPPGARFDESGTNWILLGMVIERVTRHPLARELRRRIIRPLHLRHTRYELGTLEGTQLHGYDPLGAPFVPGPDGLADVGALNGSAYGAAGAIVSNTADLARFLRALLRGPLLRPAELRAMKQLRPAPLPTGPAQPFDPSLYGLGLQSTQTRCGPLYGHTGATYGYRSVMVATRRASTVVTLGANRAVVSDEYRKRLGRTMIALLCPKQRR
jgi:D-alanyl-D-alanine carboxypeptidase